MKVIIDTSSLHALVRYYLPFDKNSELEKFVMQEMLDGRLIIIDKVLEECQFLSQGEILKGLSFLSDKDFMKQANLPYNTDALVPSAPRRFENLMNEQFAIQIQKKKLNKLMFENMKDDFYNSADLKQVMLCYNSNSQSSIEKYMIVTEETATNNDNKLFKKIPAICDILNIKTVPLPKLLNELEDIKFEFRSNHGH